MLQEASYLQWAQRTLSHGTASEVSHLWNNAPFCFSLSLAEVYGGHSGQNFASPEPWVQAISMGVPHTLWLERLFWLRWSDSSVKDRSLSTGSGTSGLCSSGLKISTVNLWVYWMYSFHKGKAALQHCPVDYQGSLCFICPQGMSKFCEPGWSGHTALE